MSQELDYGPLHAVIEDGMRELRIPGVAVGLIHDGREHAAGFGVTNIDHPLAVDADTLFQIGSITKTFVGTLVMRLVEQGRLDLDWPVRAYLPDFRMQDEDAAARVTMRHLLTHTAGWLGDYFDDSGMGDDALAEIVARMADLPQYTPLGEVWSYNNAGFYLAGRVIEVVTGQPFEQAMRELVLDPLGMRMSLFFPGDVMVHRFAAGHIVAGDDVKVATPWPLARAAHAAGGISSTVNDMLTYARFWLGDGTAADGTRILSRSSMDLMRAPQAAIDTFGNHVGISWMLRNVGDVRIVTHSGGTNGQISVFLTVPERGFALVVLTNANRGGELTTRVMQWALKHYLNAETPAPRHLELSEDELQPYLGRYQSALTAVELSRSNGDIMVQAIPQGGFPKKDSPPGPTPPPVRVAFIGADQIVALDPPFKDSRGEFLRHPDGQIVWLRFGGRIARRQ
jgi:CubicO group peptidase (beta-lactamase class C family)